MNEPEHEHDPAGPEPTELEPEPEPEPDDGDDGDDGESTPAEPEAHVEPGQTPEDVEKIGKALTSLQKHVARRMGEILGEAAQGYVTCELCTPFDTPGWRPDIDLPDDVRDALRFLLGASMVADLRNDPHSITCAECGGLGQVLTGSQVADWYAITCARCQGRGWEATDEVRAYAGVTVANGPAPASVTEGAPVNVVAAPENLSPAAQAAKDEGYIVIPRAVPAGA